MKKIVAVICAVAMLLSLASVSSFAEKVEAVDWATYGAGNSMSFDQLIYDDTCQKNDGAGTFLENADTKERLTISYTEGMSTITIYGWASVNNQPIASYGYLVDDEATFDAAFTYDTEDAVIAAGGENARRFKITIPVSTIKGTHTICGCVKLTDGTVVKLNRTYKNDTYNCKYNTTFIWAGEAEEPADTSIHEYSEDGHGHCFDNVSADGVLLGQNAVKEVKADSASEVKFAGWVGYNSAAVDTYCYSVDGGTPVAVDGAKTEVAADDPVAAEGNGGSNASRFTMVINVAELDLGEGVHTIRPVAKLTNGTYYYIGSCALTFGASTVDVDAFSERNSAPSAWLGNGNPLSMSVEFNAAVPFTAVSFPQYWASVASRAVPTVTITITDANGNTVATASKDCDGDNASGDTWTFDKEVPAGQYTMTVSINDNDSYFVLSTVTADKFDADTLKFAGTTFAFALTFSSRAATYFNTLATQPVTPPATADATMVVFMAAAAALVVTVVLAKKKEF